MNLGEYLGAGSSITKGLWHLNGNSNDSSGNGNNGTDTDITYVDGKFGKCASFNGTSSYITVNQPSIGNGKRTFNFWLKTNSNVADGPSILDYDVSDTNYDRFSIRILGNNTGASSGKLRVYGRGTSGENWYKDGLTVLNDGIWRLITVVIDVSINSINIYINSVLDQGSLTGTSSSIDSLGTMIIGNTEALNHPFLMNLDEFSIENTAWTPKEVKKYYTYSKGRFGIN